MTPALTGLNSPIRLADMAKTKTGGRRAGAGRKTMFDGPRGKFGISLTVEALKMVAEIRAELEPVYGSAATDAGAAEYLIRRGYARDRRRKQKVEPVMGLNDLREQLESTRRRVDKALRDVITDAVDDAIVATRAPRKRKL